MYEIECAIEGVAPAMFDRFFNPEETEAPKTKSKKKWKDNLIKKMYVDKKGVYVPADNLRMMIIGNTKRPGAAKILGSFIEKGKATQYLNFCKACTGKTMKGEEKKTKKAKGGGKPDPAGISPDQIIEGTKLAAEYAKVSARTIRRWVQEGMYCGRRGTKRIYIKNVLDVYKLHHGKELCEDRKREQTAEADYKEIKAKLLAMDLKVRTGELIERQEIERQWVQRIQAVKRAFLGLGRKLAPQLARLKDPRKIQARIDAQIREIITTFTGK